MLIISKYPKCFICESLFGSSWLVQTDYCSIDRQRSQKVLLFLMFIVGSKERDHRSEYAEASNELARLKEFRIIAAARHFIALANLYVE